MPSTLGTDATAKLHLQENYSLDISLECDTVVKMGRMVKMNNDGTCTPVTATTDIPVGMVVVGNKVIGELVTIKTPFVAIMKGQSDGTTDEGNYVACSGWDATNELSKYKVAVTGDIFVGQVLQGGLTTTAIKVGLFRVPTKKYGT